MWRARWAVICQAWLTEIQSPLGAHTHTHSYTLLLKNTHTHSSSHIVKKNVRFWTHTCSKRNLWANLETHVGKRTEKKWNLTQNGNRLCPRRPLMSHPRSHTDSLLSLMLSFINLTFCPFHKQRYKATPTTASLPTPLCCVLLISHPPSFMGPNVTSPTHARVLGRAAPRLALLTM